MSFASTLATHFAQLTLGMTEDQVVANMGKPTDSQQGSGNRSGMLWKPAEAPDPAKSTKKKPGKEAKSSKTAHATEPEVFAVAYFVSGKLTDMDCSEVPPKTHELTIANAHRIRVGQSAAEVEQILGPPAETKPLNDNVRNQWRHGKDRLSVVLKDGVVWHISSTLASLPLLSFEKTNEDRINQALANLTSGDEKRPSWPPSIRGRSGVRRVEGSRGVEGPAPALALEAAPTDIPRRIGPAPLGNRRQRRHVHCHPQWPRREIERLWARYQQDQAGDRPAGAAAAHPKARWHDCCV